LTSKTVTQAYADGYSITTFSAPGVSSTALWGVNNAGTIAGSATYGDASYAILVHNGAVTQLSGPSGAVGAVAADINDSGVVVGNYWSTTITDPDTGETYAGPNSAFIYNGSSYSTFSLPGAVNTQARGVSPDGRFVSGLYSNDQGSGAFVYDTTGVLPTQYVTGLSTLGQGIDARNMMVGSDAVGDDVNGYQKVGFTYDVLTGERHDYSFNGYLGTAFRDITSDGRIGGYLLTNGSVDGVDVVGFFGTPDNFQTIEVPGAMETVVEGVNDQGMLVGSYFDADGTTGSFVAMPVPEPATWMLSLGGLLTLAALRRRRA
jgi:uncharacterized membrane protein